MTGNRMVLAAALVVAALPARAMFGFGPPHRYFAGWDAPWSARQVLVEDVNQDGLDDVLLTVVDSTDPFQQKMELAVLLQDAGTHELDDPIIYPFVPDEWETYGISSITRADVNGDGVDDVVVGHTDGVSILDPADGFAVISMIEKRESYFDSKIARAGDIDGDGKQDIALLTVTSGNVSSVVVHHGEGRGHFDGGMSVLLPDHACFSDMRVLDLNHDGRQDLLLYAEQTSWNEQGAHGFWAFYNQGAGTFGHGAVLVSSSGFSGNMAVGDIDGDGTPDLASWYSEPGATNYRPNARLYLHGRMGAAYRNFKLWPASTSWTYSGSPLIHDMNGDGKPDFVFSEVTGYIDPSDFTHLCYANYAPSAGKYVYRYRISCIESGDVQSAGDINGDGLADLVSADRDFGMGWVLGTNSPDIKNVVVGEGLSTGTVAFNAKNASTTATIVEPSVEVTLAVNRGKITLTSWPQACSRPDPGKTQLTCNYADLAVGSSASGVVHYSVAQSTPYMQLTATTTVATLTEETIVSDNTTTASTWIRQL